METLAPAAICRHHRLHIATDRPVAFVDLTDRLAEVVAASGLHTGLLNLHTRHTTTAIVLNEHEPLLLADFEALLARLAPPDAAYRHDDLAVRTVNLTPGERVNGHAHCQALLLPSSATVNVAGGRLELGRWQRVFLVERDGPRPREVSVIVLGEGER